MSDTRILVLGATGNIGEGLLRILRERGADVTAGAPAPALERLRGQGVRAVDTDFDKPRLLERALRQADMLFMLFPLHRKMKMWAGNLLDIARKTGIRFIVRSSFLGADPDSPHALPRLHGRIDAMLRASGIPHAVIRPNLFMQGFAVTHRHSIVHEGEIAFARGDARVSYVDVRDIASAAAEVLLNAGAHTGRAYSLTGPRALSGLETAAILSSVTGRRIAYRSVDDEQYERTMQDLGISRWEIEMMLSLERHIREERASAVTSDVRALAGHEPRSFESFARDYRECWQRTAVSV